MKSQRTLGIAVVLISLAVFTVGIGIWIIIGCQVESDNALTRASAAEEQANQIARDANESARDTDEDIRSVQRNSSALKEYFDRTGVTALVGSVPDPSVSVTGRWRDDSQKRYEEARREVDGLRAYAFYERAYSKNQPLQVEVLLIHFFDKITGSTPVPFLQAKLQAEQPHTQNN